MPRRAPLSAVVILCVLMLLAPLPPAGAVAQQVIRDRSDNRHVFEWDTENDVIRAQSSSTVVRANDPVTFHTFARRWSSPDANRPLMAELTLTLNGGVSKARRYDGSFMFIVHDNNGDVVRRRAKHRNFALRPESAERRKQVRFWFNLPDSGNYDIIGRFRSS